MDPKQRYLKCQQNDALKHSSHLQAQYYKESSTWCCEDCCIVLTSESQAQEHFSGKRHQNVIKQKAFYYDNIKFGFLMHNKVHEPHNFNNSLMSEWYRLKNGTNNILNCIPPPARRDNILETVVKNEKRTVSKSDLSIYRTPSGKYYCQPCNLTVNSQAQFLQHSESRKHRQKATKTSYKLK